MYYVQINESLGLAFYHYEFYRKNTEAKGEKPLSMLKLLFKK